MRETVQFFSSNLGIPVETVGLLLYFLIVLVVSGIVAVIFGLLIHRRKGKPRRISRKRAERLIRLVMKSDVDGAYRYWQEIGCPTSREVPWGEFLPGNYDGDSRMMVDFFDAAITKQQKENFDAAQTCTSVA